MGEHRGVTSKAKTKRFGFARCLGVKFFSFFFFPKGRNRWSETSWHEKKSIACLFKDERERHMLWKILGRRVFFRNNLCNGCNVCISLGCLLYSSSNHSACWVIWHARSQPVLDGVVSGHSPHLSTKTSSRTKYKHVVIIQRGICKMERVEFNFWNLAFFFYSLFSLPLYLKCVWFCFSAVCFREEVDDFI